MSELTSATHASAGEVFSRELVRRLLFPMTLAVLAYGLLLFYADFDAIVVHVAHVPLRLLAAATLASVGSYGVRFLRWQFYLHRLELHVPLRESLLVFVSGFAMSITPGKFGEALKSLLLKESQGVPIARSAPIVLAERITDLAGLLILGAVGSFGLPSGALGTAAALSCVLVLFAVCSVRSFGSACIALLTRHSRTAHLRAKLADAYEALFTLTRPVPFVLGVVSAVLAWGVSCLCVNLIAWSFTGVELSIADGFLAFSAPLLAGTLALVPGGLGLTEASMTGMLDALGGAGMTPSVAAAITILVRLVSFWLAIVLGFAALGLWRARRSAVAGSSL